MRTSMMPTETTLPTDANGTQDACKAAPQEDEECEGEWVLETPPKRPARTVRMTFVRAGYRPPKIAESPED